MAVQRFAEVDVLAGFEVAPGEVGAGTEGAARAGDEEAAHRRFGLRAGHRGGEALMHLDTECIQFVRPVEREAQYAGVERN